MKILITTDWYKPIVNGVVTSVLNLKRELEERGHEVRVLTLSETGASYRDNEVYYVKSMDLGSIYPNARAVLPYSNPYISELIDWEPDVVHSQCEFMTFQYASKISRRCGCPLLHTYHTIYADYMHYLPGVLGRYTTGRKAGKKAVAEFSRTILNRTDRVIAPTGKVKDILSTYQVKPAIDVIPSGIDLRKFSGTLSRGEKDARKEALGIPKQNKVLVSVGRLAKEKNLEEILEYFARLLAEGRENLTLLIAGDGPDRENLEHQSKQLGIEENVCFTGMVAPKEVWAYYQLGDIFVCASKSETQGITYIEALASGVPALCRKDECLDGVIADGCNGFQYETYEYFRMHLLYLLENEERRQEMAKMAKEMAEEFSTWNFCTMVERAYRAACEEKEQIPVFQRDTEHAAWGRAMMKRMMRRVS